MTRHGKNNTASACYTYHERQLDTKKSGYGTQKQRLGKDSVKDFDACSLTLQPCRNPVITPNGVIYDKEAIYEYIIQNKVKVMNKFLKYKNFLKKEEKELAELNKAKEKSKTEKFLKLEMGFVGKEIVENDTKTSSVSNMVGESRNKLPSFWIPSLTPKSNTSKFKKPDKNIYCPTTGEILKIKDLIPIKFTLIDPNEKNLIGKKDRYMCPITRDVLSNSVPCAVLKTSGIVVTMDCVEKIIKKDMIDPINNKSIKESDIIRIQRGGTGYAETNQLVAQIKKPVMQA